MKSAETCSGPGRRDYSLNGSSTLVAVELGLASAEWYRTDVPRKEMKALMQRTDGPALRDTAIWLGLLVVAGAAIIGLWGTRWAVPFAVIYGVLYGSASDSRWHECGHGTAFRTQWMNDVVYQIASFMEMRNPVTWRWSHTRHHTDTYIVGRDPEIVVMRPPNFVKVLINFIGLVDFWYGAEAILLNSAGRLSADEMAFTAGSERQNAIKVARVHLSLYVATVVASIYFHSWLPLVLVGGPRIYGIWHATLTGLLEHGGLADNVIDHRLNSRTVYVNPISRFIMWNMNYHVEHHMFPMVPYHALPKLHALIKHDMPAADPSMIAAYKEMTPAFIRQLRNEDYFLKRELPPGARPY